MSEIKLTKGQLNVLEAIYSTAHKTVGKNKGDQKDVVTDEQMECYYARALFNKKLIEHKYVAGFGEGVRVSELGKRFLHLVKGGAK